MESSSQSPSLALESKRESHHDSIHTCVESQSLEASNVGSGTETVAERQEEDKEVAKCDSSEPLDKSKEKDDENGRERLKRHRREVAGKVWIPDIWGQEDFLKDWIDCSAFEANLLSHRIMSARSALAQQGRATPARTLSVGNSC